MFYSSFLQTAKKPHLEFVTKIIKTPMYAFEVFTENLISYKHVSLKYFYLWFSNIETSVRSWLVFIDTKSKGYVNAGLRYPCFFSRYCPR